MTTLVYLLARPDADAAGVLAAFPETTPEDVREAGADLAVLLRTIPGLGQAFIDAGLPRVLRDLPRWVPLHRLVWRSYYKEHGRV